MDWLATGREKYVSRNRWFFQQVMVWGRKCNQYELNTMYYHALTRVTHIEELAKVFCDLYHFEIVPYSADLRVDFVIDTDINRIYSPR